MREELEKLREHPSVKNDTEATAILDRLSNLISIEEKLKPGEHNLDNASEIIAIITYLKRRDLPLPNEILVQANIVKMLLDI